MISVPNRQQPLSGNKLSILLFGILLLFSACKTTKKSSTSRTSTNTDRTRTTTNNSRSNKAKVDTIYWKEEKLDAEIAVMTDQNMEKKGDYAVTLFIPFNSDNYSPSSLMKKGSQDFRFANYYAGVKMALKDLEREGVSMTVNVKDSESGDFTQKLNNQEKTDVIIGPYNRTQLKQTAEFCRRNKIVNVSPWQSSSKITEDNPYHVQLRPNQTAYYDAMVTDALQNFRSDQIYVIGRDSNKDQGRIRYLQKTAAALKNMDENAKPLQVYTVDPDSLINDALTYDEIFDPLNPSVIIFPHWSSEDESFIYDCLRKLAIEKGQSNLTVYGMPIFIDSDKITFDYFQNLNIRVARAKWVDRNDPKVKDFKNRFYQTYNALPADDALDGYDMMMFIGSNLWENGNKFQHVLDQDNQSYLQTSFDVQKVISKDAKRLDNFKSVNYFENRNLDIISFQRDRLVRN